MQYIGKANKFYTLWEVTENKMTSLRGNTYTVINHQYFKNISFDLNKAKKLYPNAIVDETLRGHRSWTSYKYDKPPVDEFQGGKYKGEKISECTDYNYLHWAYDLSYIIHYDSREMVLGILEEHGYRKINDSHIATPDEVEKIENSYKEVEIVEEMLERDGKITINPVRNLDGCGWLLMNNVNISFPNFKEMEYNGCPYFLPIDGKGKVKRIKNKEVEIIPESYRVIEDEYGWGPTIEINVKEFKVK